MQQESAHQQDLSPELLEQRAGQAAIKQSFAAAAEKEISLVRESGVR